MKKCSKCNKVYDDSWVVCLRCSAQLVHLIEEDTRATPQISEGERIIALGVNYQKLKIARANFKRDSIILLATILCLLVFLGISSKSHIPAIGAVIATVIYSIILHYRVFRISKEMQKDKISCYLSLVLGWIWIISTLSESKEMLRALDDMNTA